MQGGIATYMKSGMGYEIQDDRRGYARSDTQQSPVASLKHLEQEGCYGKASQDMMAACKRLRTEPRKLVSPTLRHGKPARSQLFEGLQRSSVVNTSQQLGSGLTNLMLIPRLAYVIK